MRRLFIVLFSLVSLASWARLMPTDLRCEHMVSPSCVDNTNPLLSWINVCVGKEGKMQEQKAFQIQVASSKDLLRRGKADLWDTGRKYGDEPFCIYAGKSLPYGQTCYWRVRVWNARGKKSGWAESLWHMGLTESDWKAKWISASDESVGSPLMRKRIIVDKPVREAWAYVSGLGYSEFYVNGLKCGDDVLSPAQTDYTSRKDIERTRVAIDNEFTGFRAFYVAHDITSLLRSGDNMLGCWLGRGFYGAHNGFTLPYGNPVLKAQVVVRYVDGTENVFVTDATWTWHESAIVMNGIYDGERYDARVYNNMWCDANDESSGWRDVREVIGPEGKLVAQTCPSDKVLEKKQPVAIVKNNDGSYTVDFGEEISGWVRLNGESSVDGKTIAIKYVSESPQGVNEYICDGGPVDYHARFTWFVFRKATICGWEGDLMAGNIVAEVVNTDIGKASEFSCSDTLLCKINKIWQRSLLDNAHGCVFSDCPHRERAAYMGDGQVASEMVMRSFDTRAFYAKWFDDMILAQNPRTGFMPFGAPWQPGCGGGVPWSAALCVMPWNYYIQYGDERQIEKCYEGMKHLLEYFDTWVDDEDVMEQKYVSKIEGMSYWCNLGDWCPPTNVYPQNALVHTFYYWMCQKIVSESAFVLGKKVESEKYRLAAERTKSAFHKRFYDASTHSYGPAGSNIFALRMGVPDSVKSDVVATVKNELATNKGHLYTGIYATRFFFEVLSDIGMTDEAYEALTKTDFPSFGYWIAQGATTTWEQWDGGNSHNHPMFGGGLSWLYSRLVGINPSASTGGYKMSTLKSHIPSKVSWAAYSLATSYGTLSVRWEKSSDGVTWQVTVPVGCKVEFFSPDGYESRHVILSSGKHNIFLFKNK